MSERTKRINPEDYLVQLEFDDGTFMEVQAVREFKTKNRSWVKAIDLTTEDEIINLDSRRKSPYSE
jgi:hypothetical protein